MKKQHVINCMFSSWYPTFKRVTVKSCILPLTKEVQDYLMSDGSLVLPEGSVAGISADNVSSDSDDDNQAHQVKWELDESEDAQAPSLQDFDKLVRRAINSLGGKVFPKLNWSSPKDAVWIAPNNCLACTTPGDIYLLLKSSDFVTHDLTQPFDRCEDWDQNDSPIQYNLILRRWHELNPGGEFRCFVKNNVLHAICQRHQSNYYSFINEDKACIVSDIQEFHNRIIKNNFPDKNYVFDVYRKEKNKVYVLDFNPYGPVTDGLLFTWDELENDAPDTENRAQNSAAGSCPELRFIESGSQVMPSPYGSYAMPKDFVDLTTGEDPYKLMDLLKLRQQSQFRSRSKSSDDSSESAPSSF